MRTWTIKCFVTAACLGCLFGGAASAQSPTTYTSRDRLFNIQRFVQSASPDRYITTESARTLGHLNLAISLMFTGADNPLALYGPGDERRVWVDHQVAGVFTGAFGLFNRFQLEFALPYVISDACRKTSERPDLREPVPEGSLPVCDDVEAALGKYSSTHFNGGGFGDLLLGAKVALLQRGPEGFGLSAGFALSLPIDDGGPFRGENNLPDGWDESQPRDVGDRSYNVTFVPRVTAEYAASFMRVAATLGYLFRDRYVFLPEDDGLIIDDQILFASAAEVYLPKKFSVLAEVNGAVLASTDATLLETPMEALFAVRYAINPDLSLIAGAGTGLVYGYGVPRYRIFGGLSYTVEVQEKDADNDGVMGDRDRCPAKAEDKDGFQDEDGCPDEDNDGDGVLDEKDGCPNVAADTSDGCPKAVPTDTDGDGVLDTEDRCPTKAEDKDGFQDEDGCPDEDNDGDGIADASDSCPGKPETVNGYKDEDGCPDTPPTAVAPRKELSIPEEILFPTGGVVLTAEMRKLVDEIAKRIKEHPEVKLLRIEGHSDSAGKAQTNDRLAKRRADAVMELLVKQGVDRKRLQSVGYGASRPAASNDTEEGRAKNRRVEIIVVQ